MTEGLSSSSQSITLKCGRLNCCVRAVWTHKLKTNLTIFLTLSISKPSTVQTPDLKKIFLHSIQRTTQNLAALAFVVPEISSFELRSVLAFF